MINDIANFDRLQTYEAFLEEHGQSLKKIGINGVALTKERALKALELLEHLTIPVLGGDVMRLEGELVQLTYDNWYYQRPESLSHHMYVSQSIAFTRDWILAFPEAASGTYLFQIIVDNMTQTFL